MWIVDFLILGIIWLWPLWLVMAAYAVWRRIEDADQTARARFWIERSEKRERFRQEMAQRFPDNPVWKFRDWSA